jgi:hypothetical protein
MDSGPRTWPTHPAGALIELRTQVGRWATLLLAEGRLRDGDYTNLMNAVFGPPP